MPSGIEIRVGQKRMLYALLDLKKAALSRKVDLPELDKLINSQMAEMEQEDVAYIEKLTKVKAD